MDPKGTLACSRPLSKLELPLPLPLACQAWTNCSTTMMAENTTPTNTANCLGGPAGRGRSAECAGEAWGAAAASWLIDAAFSSACSHIKPRGGRQGPGGQQQRQQRTCAPDRRRLDAHPRQYQVHAGGHQLRQGAQGGDAGAGVEAQGEVGKQAHGHPVPGLLLLVAEDGEEEGEEEHLQAQAGGRGQGPQEGGVRVMPNNECSCQAGNRERAFLGIKRETRGMQEGETREKMHDLAIRDGEWPPCLCCHQADDAIVNGVGELEQRACRPALCRGQGQRGGGRGGSGGEGGGGGRASCCPGGA